MITVHLESGGLTRTLAGLTRLSQRPRSLMQEAARAMRRDLQRHFRERDKKKNKLDGKRTNWWARVARSTQIASVTDTQAVVSISEPGIALQVAGGTVRPVEAKALTIPIHAEAHGRRAGTIESITGHKLFRVRPKGSEHTFLARSMGDDTIRLLYVLKQSADVPADPNALPDREALERSAVAAAADQLRSETRRAQLA